MLTRTLCSAPVALFGISLLLSCHPRLSQPSNGKIYGGVRSEPGAWLGTVGLVREGRLSCTGTAIHPRVVVTAAHCIQYVTGPSRVRVYVGEGAEGAKVTGQYKVTRFAYSPLYARNDAGWNDIAYLLLDQDLNLPSEAYIPVLTKADEIAEVLQLGAPATLVGYGLREDAGSGLKFEVEAPVTAVNSNEVTISSEGKDSCSGDSGGPAYARLSNGEWRVYGVTSRAIALQSPCGAGGIYGRMDANICWIQSDSGIDLGLGEFCKLAEPEPEQPPVDEPTVPVEPDTTPAAGEATTG